MRERLGFGPGVHGAIWWSRPQGRVFRSHHHDELEFNLVMQGTARYVLADRQYRLAAGDAVWLFPQHEHVLLDHDAAFSMWIICVHPDQLRRYCRSAAWATLLAAAPPGEWCRRLSGPAIAELDALFGLTVAETERPAPRRNAGLVHAALSAWDCFQASGESLAGQQLHPAVEQAIARLVAEEWPSLPALAAACGLSYSRLSRLFKQATGEALADFRNRCRLQRFLDAWDPSSGRTLLADALAAGFGSYAQFHRVFSDHLGCGPRQWLGSPS